MYKLFPPFVFPCFWMYNMRFFTSVDQLCVNPPPPLPVFSRLDKALEKVFFYHLLNVLSRSTPENLLTLQFVAFLVAGEGGLSGVVGEGGTWAAAGLTVEDLAEQVKEG